MRVLAAIGQGPGGPWQVDKQKESGSWQGCKSSNDANTQLARGKVLCTNHQELVVTNGAPTERLVPSTLRHTFTPSSAKGFTPWWGF
ncbi:hypothetical protein RirG_031720 [Rhizophagus irregularis DAOM 197198w]|uniref:Uncharacterized protein n=1 Tax=Rhizophagus irregularis (strain DAOM 197198w) TaxID=1432141 RepID=A0A015LA67_RHIIW|nr:hypothetical protein RirG_031720 [Rhizophagus irregularis DAOM 197198w]